MSLVLTCRQHEPVRIMLPDGRVARLTISRINREGGQVRLEFDFPKDILILREGVCLGRLAGALAAHSAASVAASVGDAAASVGDAAASSLAPPASAGGSTGGAQ